MPRSRRFTKPFRRASTAAPSAIVSYLTEELVALGHDVTLFASGDAVTNARLVPVRDKALRLDPSPLKSAIAAHLSMLDEVRRRADDFDVIHFHLSHFLHFPMFEHMPERTLTTLHGRLDYRDLAGAYGALAGFPMISISMRQRRPLAAWQLGRQRLSRPAAGPLSAAGRGQRPASPISPFSAACRATSGPTAPSRSPAAAA